MFKTIDLTRVALAIAAIYVLTLALGYGRQPGFLINPNGDPHPIEYTGVRAAGELVLEGRPAAAYEWSAHAARQTAITRQTSGAYYPWPYPPPYLAVAAGLAALPYVTSALLWVSATLAFLCWVATRIGATPRAVAWVLAAPPTYVNAMVAHTGFLLAGLMGLGLFWLTTAPVAAGVAFGVLVVKPQLALVLPVALAAGGHWRTLLAAGVTAVMICLASVPLFGIEPWLQFPAQLDRITDIFRGDRTNLKMLVSVYGLARTVGLDHAAALVPQGITTLAVAVAVAWLWRGSAHPDLKAAGLVVASLLASPYLYIYDLTLLIVALAFLHRAIDTFDDVEMLAIAFAGIAVFGFAALPVPAGLLANVIIAGLIVRRVWRSPAHAELTAAAAT
jgi:hypothetical protein